MKQRRSREERAVWSDDIGSLDELDWVVELAESTSILAVANNVPLPPKGRGRPREYPIWVGVLYIAVTGGVKGKHRAAARLFASRRAWWHIRNAAKKRGLNLPRLQPTREHLRGWEEYLEDHVQVVRQECREQAVRQAIAAGCFNGEGTLSNPGMNEIMFADGTVAPCPFKSEAVERRRALGKPINTGTYKQGGEDGAEYATGTKYVLVGVRTSPGHNSRIILDVEDEPTEKAAKRATGYNGEAGLAVSMTLNLADRIREAGGRDPHLCYDTALRGVHLDMLMKKGYVVLSPVHANAAGREPLKQIGECPCGLTHDLNTANGDIWEMRLLDTGEQYNQPCQRKRLEKRPNKNACSWFVEIRLSCGNTKHIRIDHDNKKKSADTKSNRAERLRQHPPGSPLYEELYGRREESESANSVLKRTLHLGRMIALTAPRQLLVMLGFMLARNVLAEHAHKQYLSSSRLRR